jgi:general secretion pathway protein I
MKSPESISLMQSSAGRGFTLIEVLASLVIVALGMMGVIQAVSQTVSNGAYLREKTLAHWIAMNRLTEVRVSGEVPDIDESSGEVEYAGQRWHWSMDVTQTPVESLRRIDVEVRRADADADSHIAIVTGFYGTAIAIGGGSVNDWDGVPGTGGEQGTEQQPDDAAEQEPEPAEGENPVDPSLPEQPTQ